MDIQQQFNIPETIAEFMQAQARREESRNHMFTHRLPGPVASQCFGIAEIDHFYSFLPSCADVNEMISGFYHEEMYRVEDSVIRNNREIVEFHSIDNTCPRCRNQLTSCVCREMTTIQTPQLTHAIQNALKRLFMDNKLLVVSTFCDGTLSVLGAKDMEEKPSYFPSFGFGVGFGAYIEDYHLNPPH